MDNTTVQTIFSSPIGEITLVSNGSALLCATFHGDLEARSFDAVNGEDRLTKLACKELKRYFAGERTRFTVPLKPEGTAFQKLVWKKLSEIPYGKLQSYGEIAQSIGNKAAVRAVGGAIGRNPLVIIIPCHRVIGANGTLTGFSSGLDRKKFLLGRESIEVEAPSPRIPVALSRVLKL